MEPVRSADFAARLNALGPFEPSPHVAVAASGGADSTALVLLAAGWAAARSGRVSALVVDHGLRPEAGREARQTADRLAGRGIASKVLTLHGLTRGPGLAERARTARYHVLEEACAQAGIVHLLIGHHAGDQAETVEMRTRAGSGAAGLAGMSAIRETAGVRLLRPLLDVDPGALRATLRAAGMAWVEDPSNQDRASLRARLRTELAAHVPGSRRRTGTPARVRAQSEWRAAATLAHGVSLGPGYAVVTLPLQADAWAAVLTAIGGAPWPPSHAQVHRLANDPAPCTLGGCRILHAGRRAPGGWLVAREAAAMGPSVPARPGQVWDRRFRLRREVVGAQLGALGAACAGLRERSGLPRAVLETLPAILVRGEPVAVPHLGIGTEEDLSAVVWAPARPMTCAPFAPSFSSC